MSRILITNGCSFSEGSYTWTGNLYGALQQYGFSAHVCNAKSSQGNGLISRGIVYNVTKALRAYKSENIFVGVMWSGPDRMDYRCSFPGTLSFIHKPADGKWHPENPVGFVENANKHWVIMNHHWTNVESTTFYTNFYDPVGAVISSLEHMLRVQWFLKEKNINYFFTVYQDFVLQQYNTHPEVEYLYSLLDKNNFLPVSSEYAWILKNSKFNWRDSLEQAPHPSNHPSREQHKDFTENVIIPWLKEKKYV